VTNLSHSASLHSSEWIAPSNPGIKQLVYNRSVDAADALREELLGLGATVHLLQSDITREIICIDLMRKAADLTDSLDALVDNAVGLVGRLTADAPAGTLIEETYALNVFSLMKNTSLAIPLLRKGQNPSIVNITSVASRLGAAGATLCESAKGAADTLTRGWCKALAPTIRVNSMSPGVIDTPFHVKVSSPEEMFAGAEANPLQRNGTAAHIALAIKFVTENDFVHGESLDPNGGQLMR